MAENPRHFKESRVATSKTFGHFNDFKPTIENPAPFQLFLLNFSTRRLVSRLLAAPDADRRNDRRWSPFRPVG
jgi:hypothetical protein